MHPSFLQNIRSNALGPSARAHIDLTNCFIGPKELELFTKSIQKNIAKNTELTNPIVTINLAGNRICGVEGSGEGEFEYRGFKAFSSCCVQRAKQLRLRKLNLSSNQLGKRGFQLVASILFATPVMTDLSLRDCGGDSEALSVFLESVDKSKALTALDLSRNPVGVEGCKELAKYLRGMKKMKALDLSSCDFGSEGSRIVCMALTLNNSIATLILSGNDIGDAGAEAVGNLIRDNAVLMHVDLQDNKISSIGAGYLGEGLTNNRSLQSLALQWNDIGNQGGYQLAAGIRGNAVIRAIFIFGNRIDEETATALVESSAGSALEVDVKVAVAAKPRKISSRASSPIAIVAEDEEI